MTKLKNSNIYIDWVWPGAGNPFTVFGEPDLWFIDTDYNGESFYVRQAYFTEAEVEGRPGRSELPTFPAHHAENIDARDSQTAAHVGDELRPLRIFLRPCWRFLSNHDPPSQFGDRNHVGIGLGELRFGVS